MIEHDLINVLGDAERAQTATTRGGDLPSLLNNFLILRLTKQPNPLKKKTLIFGR
jgi:hypothetical protein